MRWQAPIVFVVLALVLGVVFIWWDSDGPATVDIDSTTRMDGDTLTSPSIKRTGARTANSAGETKDPIRAKHPVATDEASWRVAGAAKRGWEHPFPGATVRIELFEGYLVHGEPFATKIATADDEGAFEVGFPAPERTVTIRARPGMENARPTSTERTVVFEAEPPNDLEVRIYPLDRTIKGRVVDEHGKGLAGSRIQTRYREASLPCSEDGTFELRVSSAERLTLRAAAPGYAMNQMQVTLPESGAPDPVTITLQPGLTIHGRVVDEANQPVANADITTFFTNNFTHVLTDEDGKFTLDYLHRGRDSHSLFARKEGYIEARARILTREPKDSYDLVLRRGTRVEGIVRSARGQPIPGAPLYIGFDPSAYDRLDATADDEGNFVFPVVGEGEHDLVVEMPGHAPKKMKLVVPKDTPLLAGIVVQLGVPHFVSGIVKDENGNALAGIRVHARLPSIIGGRRGRGHDRYIGESTQSNKDGKFRLDDLPGDIVNIEFYGRAVLRHVENSVQVDRADLEIQLQRAARLAGRVVAADTKQPITSFRIKFLESNSGGYSASWLRGHDIRSEDGRWRTDTDNLKPGDEFMVEASAKGFGRVLKKMHASIEPKADAVLFELTRGQTIRGHVLARRSGRPVGGARVMLFSELDPIRRRSGRNRETRLTATTDAEGGFTLNDVPISESISLSIEHKDFPIATDGPFVVAEGVPTERRILLESSARINGTIVDGTGSPIANAEIQLLITSPKLNESIHRQTRSDADGRYEFTRALPPGTCTLDRRSTEEDDVGPFTICKARFELEAGSEKTIRLAPPGSCSITGSIRKTDGSEPPKFVLLYFHLKGGGKGRRPHYSVRAIDGRFNVRGLPKGSYDAQCAFFIGSDMWMAGKQGIVIKPGNSEPITFVLRMRKMP